MGVAASALWRIATWWAGQRRRNAGRSKQMLVAICSNLDLLGSGRFQESGIVG